MKQLIECAEMDVKRKDIFPCVLGGKSIVVMFHAHGMGYVIASSAPAYPVGHYLSHWDMSYFHAIEGKIKIEVSADV